MEYPTTSHKTETSAAMAKQWVKTDSTLRPRTSPP